jgi:hypothetical protein
MPLRRCAGLAVLGHVLLSMVGCDGGTPPDGARAIAPADHLEKQRMKLAQMKASMKAQPSVKHGTRH